MCNTAENSIFNYIPICMVVLTLTGCASHQSKNTRQEASEYVNSGWSRFKEKVYILPFGSDNNSATAHIQVRSVRLGGNTFKIRPKSRRAAEIRSSITNFVSSLSMVSINNQKIPSGRYYFSLIFDGFENSQAAGAILTSVISGTATLGLVSDIMPAKYDYKSLISIEALIPGETTTNFTTQSEVVRVKYNLNFNTANEAGSIARIKADSISLQRAAEIILNQNLNT